MISKLLIRKYKNDEIMTLKMKTALSLVFYEIKKYKKLIFIGAFLIIITSLLALPDYFFLGIIVDRILPGKDYRIFIAFVLCMLFLKILITYFNYNVKMIFFKVNNKITIDIRKKLFEKINELPLKNIENFSTGYLMSRIQDDPPRVSALFGDQIINLLKQIVVFTISIVALLFINFKLAIITILQLPFLVYTVHYYGNKIKKQADKVFEYVSLLSKSLHENINMIPTCKYFGAINYNVSRYVRTSLVTLKHFISLRKLECTNSLIMGILGSILPMTIIAIGVYDIMYANFTLGLLITFMSILSTSVGSICEVISFYPELKKIDVALLRIGNMLIMETDNSNEICYGERITKLKLNNVSFSYEDNKMALDNISFTVTKGMKVAIVGHSGCGKTTLTKILAGFYDFQGEIIINDLIIDSKSRNLLSKKVSIVPQESFLFNESIHKNVSMGSVEINKAKVNNALKKAKADEFIKKLNDSIHTKVGEGGNKLSVGEKQRISIARSLARGCDILILDEATSNIDNVSKNMILESIDELSKDMIVFIIDHNFENIKDCDAILVFDNGKLVESGTEDELIRINGIYASLIGY